MECGKEIPAERRKRFWRAATCGGECQIAYKKKAQRLRMGPVHKAYRKRCVAARRKVVLLETEIKALRSVLARRDAKIEELTKIGRDYGIWE